MDEALKDERFSHILTDPRFRRIPKNVRKVKVDQRFKNLLKTKHFNEKRRVDERGRSLNLSAGENFQNLYTLEKESSDSEESDQETKEESPSKSSKKKNRKDKVIEVCSSKESKKKRDSSKKKSDKLKSSKVEKKSQQNLESGEEDHMADSTEYNEKDDDFAANSIRISQKKKVKKEELSERDSRFSQVIESEEVNLLNQDNDEDDDPLKDETDSSEDESEGSNSDGSIDEEESEDSDSEDDSDSAGENSDSFDHEWEEHHEKAPDTNEITRRLAVCNMDWDRIRAIDLFAVFNSFKPADTSILSVKVYPSEYGLQRMEEERLKGPPELVEKTLAPDEEEVEDKKGGKYNREKLRQYQINRLKYYYAIVECDTPETANTLYEELNGMEYESSSVRFDLRFVPDDMTFDHEPTSTAGNDCDMTEYKPRLFVTTALQQVKVGLTWDETDPHRRETLQKAFTEPDTVEQDIKQFLASSSDESQDEDNNEGGIKTSARERIQKYKSLLESIDKEEKEKKNGKIEMEITWDDNTEEASTKDAIEKYNAMIQSMNKKEAEKTEEKYDMEITWASGVKEKTENLIKDKMGEKSITPFEEMQRKKKEKQKLKKKERKLQNKIEESEDNDDDHVDEYDSEDSSTQKSSMKSKTTNELYLISDAKDIGNVESQSKGKKKLKNKKKKVKQEVNEDVEIDVNDPRFSAIYTSPLFNIDPSDPHFKRTPGNLAIIAEKQRRLKKKALSQGGNSNKKTKCNL